MINKRNLLTVLLLGFSSGLPIALVTSTLQAWFTVTGASMLTIGTLGLVGQPYIYKFLWAPLLDRYIPPLLGRRRGWLLITQFCLVVAIAAMAFGNPQIHPLTISILAVIVATLSATQDIAVDAYRTDILQPQERGIGAALTTWGYRVAMLISGGLALVLASAIGWHTTYLIMASLMTVGIVASWFAEEPLCDTQHQSPPSLLAAITEPLREFLSRKSAWMILLFILLYKLGDALSVSLTTPFLLRGLGFSLVTVGLVNKGAGLIATMLGILVGGVLMTRLNLFRALFLFGILQAIAILALMLLAIVGKNYYMLITAIAIDNFCNAMGTVAFVAFLMSLCDHRYTATQFALFSAFAAVGRVFVGPVAGLMTEFMDWQTFFAWALIASVPGLWLLWRLRARVIAPTSA